MQPNHIRKTLPALSVVFFFLFFLSNLTLGLSPPGGGQFIPIYMHVRVLVAAYLFQTGYGHFSFFWLKSDFGLYRVCQVSLFLLRPLPGCAHQTLSSRPRYPLQVLFRLNFLVLVLCVVMDRPYQFYYFVPLVTFWFVVIYATLATWPQILQKQANGNAVVEGSSSILFVARFDSSSVLVCRQLRVASERPA